MKVLIVNIDRNYRSVYTGLIAACLMKKIPGLRITGLISSANELLKTTGQFEELHFIDTEDFFARTKNLPSPEVEKEIKTILKPVSGHWDVVINLSSNLLGSILVNFLDYKEVKGTYLDKDLSGLKFSDLHSFCLSRLPEDFNSYLHFTFLYRSILKRFEEITLGSAWKPQDLEELAAHFRELCKVAGKDHVVFVDSGLASGRRSSDIDFTADLFKRLQEEGPYLPVLFGPDLDEKHPLVKKLKETVSGEVLAISSQNEAQLSVLGIASLVITDDLYVKSVADLGMRQSLLLSKTLNLSDFSIVKGSFQVVTDSRGSELAEGLLHLCDHMLKGEMISSENLQGIEAYRTETDQQLPVLAPVNTGGSPEYANWWLGFKFMSKVCHLNAPVFNVNKQYYKSAISREQQRLLRKEREGIYSFALELSNTEIGGSYFTDEQQLQRSLQQFFSSEEASP